jgi:hypothetical protein
MNGYWENLRPFERRVVIAAGVFLFLVLNYVFVFPYFGQWSKLDDRMFQAQRKMRLFETELTQTNVYVREVRRMESEGAEVPAEDQVRHFANTIDVQAAKCGVNINVGNRTTTSTNQFFIEQTRTIQTISQEPQLVDFLFSLGAQNSLIRVRDLTLGPDPAHQQLVARITLAASYQKQVSGRPETPKAGSKSIAARSGPSSNLTRK